MSMTMEERNAMLRRAVEQRGEAQAAGVPRDEWYGVTEPMPKTKPAEVRVYGHDGECCRGPSATGTRAEQTLRQAIDAVRDRHTKYGPPTEHFARTAALVNAAFGTTFTAADWALVMVLDKVSRQLGDCQTDDAAVDIAGYAACHQECRA